MLEAVKSVWSQRGRTLATLSVVSLAVALCVAALAIGGIGRVAVQDEFDARKAHEVLLQDTGKDLSSSRGFSYSINSDFVNLGGVVSAGPLIELQGVDATSNRHQRTNPYRLSVYGADTSTLEALGASYAVDVWWQPGACMREALVGRRAARSLQLLIDPADPSTIDINGVPIAVVGEITETDRRGGLLDGLVVPECTARSLGIAVASREVIIEVEPGAADSVAERAALVARPEDPSSLEVSFVPNAVGLRRAVERTTQQLILFFGFAVAAMSILVLGISAASAVALRRAELGLRRVFGARRSDLYLQVLLESAFVGVAGGVTGGTVGLGAVYCAAVGLGWQFVVPGYLFVAGGPAGACIGMCAGVLPAFLAVRIEPRVALQAPL